MIDLIIPHYGSQDLLDRCLASVRAHAHPPLNVFVHDNNSVNRGFARAVNTAVQQGTAPYVVLLNNDTVAPAGWLSPLQQILERDTGIAGVGPLSTAPSQWQGVSNVAKWLGRDLPASGYLTTADGPFPSSLAFWCVMIRRSALELVGPLDEGYFMYGEDDDWCLRAHSLGLEFALDLSTVVRHDHRANYSAATKVHHERSREKFRRRWGDARVDCHWSVRLADGEVPALPVRQLATDGPG